MAILSSREVNQDFGGAKRAAYEGPVIITDRGRASHVLLDIESYRKLKDPKESVIEGLSSDDTVDLDDYIPHRSVPSRKVIFD